MKVLSQSVRTYLSLVLGVLSSPQKAPCLIYLTGLIWLIKFRSIQTIAEHFGHGNVDRLHHFIRHSPKTSREMTESSQDFVAAKVQGQEVRLIIDDTTCSRKGETIEGLGWHHSGNGLVKGLCAVTAVLRVSGQTYAWDTISYVSRKILSDGFRSKVEIADDIITAARKKPGSSVTVLMDSWYSCAQILNSITLAGWVYVAAVRSNRNVIVDGRKIPVRNLAKGPRDYQTVRLSKKRVFRVARRTVLIPKVGLIVLFITKHRNITRFLISNDLDLTAGQMVLLYNERFEIEFFHKDIKQHLGFGEMFTRSRDCAQKHWTLVMIAYNCVALMSRLRSRSFRRKIENVRRLNSTESMEKINFVT